jgi:hypothetical protein
LGRGETVFFRLPYNSPRGEQPPGCVRPGANDLEHFSVNLSSASPIRAAKEKKQKNGEQKNGPTQI